MAKGGFREGAGRKKKQKSYSDKFKTQLWKSLEKQGKIHGMTVFEIFAKTIFDPKTQDSSLVGLWKILFEVMATKETRTIIEEHNLGPTIGLPPIKEKPKEYLPDPSTKIN